MVARIAWCTSPNVDEAAHLAAGLYHWQTGRFDVYRVNPPLVRLWCSWPLVAYSPIFPSSSLVELSSDRREWQLGEILLDSWSPRDMRLRLFVARMMNDVWSLIGAFYVGRWAANAFGGSARWIAMILWCFCPNLLAWSATVCPDVGGAALSIAAGFHFRCFLVGQGRWQVVEAGLWTGMAILAKATCIVLLVAYVLLLLIGPKNVDGRRLARDLGRLVVLGLISLCVIQVGYFGEHGVWRMRSLKFRHPWISDPTNCFVARWIQQSMVGDLPVPIPANLVRGIDDQLDEFRRGRRSYWARCWSDRGWWHYYLCAASVKLPLGCYSLCVLAIIAHRKRDVCRSAYDLDIATGCGAARWREWSSTGDSYDSVDFFSDAASRRQEVTFLAVPAAVFAVAVSAQTGFSHHFRYAFPCLPFLYVALSSAVGSETQRRTHDLPKSSRYCRVLGWISVLGVVLSSLHSWPWSHSYFHELVGGPNYGYRYLLDSNLEWGEDIYRAAEWCDKMSVSGPVYCGFLHDRFARRLRSDWQGFPDVLEPGWYCVSIQRVLDPKDSCHRLGEFPVWARVGASLLVYKLQTPSLAWGSIPPVRSLDFPGDGRRSRLN